MRKKILLVEGKTDENVVKALCEQFKLSIPEDSIIDCEGDSKLCDKLDNLLKALIPSSDKHEVIGVIIDADKNTNKPGGDPLQNRWDQVANILKKKNIKNVPEKPDKKGTILPGGKIKIGVWLMPNNTESGMMEDFLIATINNDAKNIIENSIATAKEAGITSFKDGHHSKAVVHTYLAWQDKPGRSLKDAITAKKFTADNELANNFADWLKKLFN